MSNAITRCEAASHIDSNIRYTYHFTRYSGLKWLKCKSTEFKILFAFEFIVKTLEGQSVSFDALSLQSFFQCTQKCDTQFTKMRCFSLQGSGLNGNMSDVFTQSLYTWISSMTSESDSVPILTPNGIPWFSPGNSSSTFVTLAVTSSN